MEHFIKIKKSIPKLLVLAMCVCMSAASFGQQAKLKIGDKAFKVYNFTKALEVYEDVLLKYPENIYALRKAAICYDNLGMTATAAERMKALYKLEGKTAADLILFAQILEKQGAYANAAQMYGEVLKLEPNNDIAIRHQEDPEWYLKIFSDSLYVEIKNQAINTQYSDFGTSFFYNDVVFSSARKEGAGSGKTYAWNDQAFLNVYRSALNSDSSLAQPRIFQPLLNSKYHEGQMALDTVNGNIFFTRNNYLGGKKEENDEGILELGIYYADIVGDSIGDEVDQFPFNEAAHSVGHPTVNADGTEMYFVSNMPGGYGGTDLYRTTRNGDFWGNPINLGPKINSAGDEMFPFLQGEELYFSSNGHPGLGGLDIFRIDLDVELTVNNIGFPINSAYDDFAPAVFDDDATGYFSSNRPGGKGDDDIYFFRISNPDSCTVRGMVIDLETKMPIAGADMYWKNEETGEIRGPFGKTDANGRYEATMPYAKNLTIVSQAYDYFSQQRTVPLRQAQSEIDDVNFQLKKFDSVATGIVRYAENNAPAQDAYVKLMDERGFVLDSIATGPDGRFRFGLLRNNYYELSCEKIPYATQYIALDLGQDAPYEITTDFRLFRPQKGQIVKLDNIYYDYNKDNIRSDAALELDKLVRILQDYPKMVIELRSHTDARGKSAYNQNLSDRRAQSAVNYLIEQGVSKSRLVPQGYGETQIINECEEGVKCSDELHEENRRTEFKILDI